MRLFFFVIFVFFGCSSIAQNTIDSVLSKIKITSEKNEKLVLLDTLSNLMFKERHELSKEKFEESIDLAIEISEFDIAVKKLNQLISYYEFGGAGEASKVVTYAKQLLKKKNSLKDPINEAKLYFILGRGVFHSQKSNQDVIIHVKKAIEVCETIKGAKTTELYARSHYYLSTIYSELGEIVPALQYAEEGAKLYEALGDTIWANTSRSIKADLLSRNGLYDEAKEIRDEIYESALKTKDNYLLIYLKINEGVDYSMQGNSQRNFECLLQALPYAELEKKIRPNMAHYVYARLARIYAEKGDLLNAKKFLDKIEEMDIALKYRDGEFFLTKSTYYFATKELDSALFYASKNYEFTQRGEFNYTVMEAESQLSKIYAERNNYEKAYYFRDRAAKLNDSLNDVTRGKTFSYYQTLYETEKKDKAIVELESEKEIASSKRNTLIMLLFSVCLIAFGIWKRGVNKRKALAKELERNTKDLETFTTQLLQKSKEHELLETELIDIKKNIGASENFEAIQKLISSKILTKQDWLDFKEKFSTVYPLFFPKMKKKGYKLTTSEERLVSLEKLGLSSEEIANMLGISFDSVLMNRYRLRKKVNAPKEISIVDFLESTSKP